MSKALTLVELVVVCVILGVLLRIGSVMYSNTHEKARTAEARSMLGYIRTAEENYKLENDTYTNSFSDLDVDVQQNCADATQYFSYTLSQPDTNHFTATATRCTAAGSKAPPGATAYTLTLNQDGNLTVSGGY